MRALLIVALGAMAFAAPAGAEHSEGTGPKNDLAAGSGNLGTTLVPAPGGAGELSTAMSFNFNAHDTVAGIHGHVTFHGARGLTGTGEEMDVKGHVVCFEVRGNRAAAVFSFGEARPFGEDFNFGLLVVEDNGQPGDETPDRGIATGISGPEGEPLLVCPPGLSQFEVVTPLVSGNVIVHDAAP